MIRAAILVDERDRSIGRVNVPETVFVVRHGGATFVRTSKGLRLGGGGIGVVFEQTEVYVREKLEPA